MLNQQLAEVRAVCAAAVQLQQPVAPFERVQELEQQLAEAKQQLADAQELIARQPQ